MTRSQCNIIDNDQVNKSSHEMILFVPITRSVMNTHVYEHRTSFELEQSDHRSRPHDL